MVKRSKRVARPKSAIDKKQSRAISRLTNMIEQHTTDVSVNDQAHTAPTLYFLTGVAEGDGSGNRTGLKVTGKQLIGNYYVQWNTSVLHKYPVRVMIIKDKASNGTTPSYGNILEGTSAVELQDNAFTDRFKILYDTYVNPPASFSETSSAINMVYKSFKLNLGNMPVRYNDSGSTSSSNQSNHLLCMFVTEGSTNVSSPDVQLKTRFIFDDI